VQWRRLRREARFLKRVLKRLDEKLQAGSIKGPADLHQALLDATQETLSYGGARTVENPERLAEAAVRAAIPPSVELLAEFVLGRSDELLGGDREFREGFEARLRDRWGQALQLAEVLRLVALEAGMSFHQRHQPASGDWVYAALVRLHARGCLIGSEIVTLLRSGHASGAHARWRALHELAVVAFFLKKHGQEVARQYLLHDAVASYRALADYQRFARELNYEPFSEAEMLEIRRRRDELCKAFGHKYGEDYGWAAQTFGFAPNFRQIEDDVDLAKWRPYYRWASHSIHAGPKALRFDLGMLDPDALMLAGPSNAGLADPGHSMCISLGQITTALLSLRPDLGDVVVMQFLLGLADAAGEAFIAAHRAQEMAAGEEAGPLIAGKRVPLQPRERDG
jgi:hypothetical protein